MDSEQTVLETLKALHQIAERLEKQHFEAMSNAEGFEKSAEISRHTAMQLEVQIHALRGALGEIEKLSPSKPEYSSIPTTVDATLKAAYPGGVGHFNVSNSGYVDKTDWSK
jgi:hypothetical protein